MTYLIYSHQQLQRKSIARLKQIYSEIGCKVEVTDKRCKDAWVVAITEHQARKIQKVDEQALAQAELDQYIAAQSQAVAPQPLTTVQITSNHYEVYCGKELIAYITYDCDEFATQPWLVMVNGVEKFRATTPALCDRYIEWHHKDGTLRETFPAPLEVPEVPRISQNSSDDQEAFVGDELVASICFDYDNGEDLYWRVIINDVEIFRDLSRARCHSFIKQMYQQGRLPVQEPFIEDCGISDEISAQIACECQKYGFKLYDGKDIYSNRTKIGEVSYTDNNWWVLNTKQPNLEKVLCDSPSDAVWWLSVTNKQPTQTPYCQQILHKPLEQLTAADWRWLQQHEIVTQLVAV